MMPVRWRQLVWAVLLLAYALLVHYSNLGRAPPVLGALAVVILLLSLFVRRSIWSLWVNFLLLQAIVLLFATECLWPRRALPHAPHASPRDMAQLLR